MPKPIKLNPRRTDAAKTDLSRMDTPFAYFSLHVEPRKKYVRLFINGSVQPGSYEAEEEEDDSFLAMIRRAVRKTERSLDCRIFLTGFDLKFDLKDLDGDFEDLMQIDPVHRAYLDDLAMERQLSETRKKPGASASLDAKLSVPGVSLTGTMAAPAVENSVTETFKTTMKPSDVKFHGKPVLDFDGLRWVFESPLLNLDVREDLIRNYGALIEAMDVGFEMTPMGRLTITGDRPGFTAVMHIGRLGHAFTSGKEINRRQQLGAEAVVDRLTTALKDGFFTFEWEAEDDAKRA